MYQWSVFLHLLFVTFWIGGMLFTAAVLVPATRKRLASQRGLLFTKLGTRFSRLSWLIFPLLIFTGYTALFGRGFTNDIIFSINFWQSSYGSILSVKVSLFVAVLIVSGIHDFWLGPKAAQLMDEEPTTNQAMKYRTATSWIGRINLLLGLAIVYFAVTLVRG